MNVGFPGNITVPLRLRKTRAVMGEIVDLEDYRRLIRRRKAEAEKDTHGQAPDGGNDRTLSPSSTAKPAEPARRRPKDAAKSGGDEPNID